MTEHKQLGKIRPVDVWNEHFKKHKPCYHEESAFKLGVKNTFKLKNDAVEGLKKDITDLYHKIGKVEVWEASNDVVCEMCEEYVISMINKWFGGKEWLVDLQQNKEQ